MTSLPVVAGIGVKENHVIVYPPMSSGIFRCRKCTAVWILMFVFCNFLLDLCNSFWKIKTVLWDTYVTLTSTSAQEEEESVLNKNVVLQLGGLFPCRSQAGTRQERHDKRMSSCWQADMTLHLGSKSYFEPHLSYYYTLF
ncbi:hypothetical protein AMECASPLE_001756 [Ameca splendens]|uniref:Uncharacterized protein n=1 Tax=Ameca splendens TaxID=208324 RepID=A0ABV0YK44_9TELE